MEYTIDLTVLKALVDEEVAKVADGAYSDSGESLFDSVVLTSRDDALVARAIEDAVHAFVARAFDICKYITRDESEDDRLIFHVPDFDDTMEGAALSEITHYVVFAATAAILVSRRAQAVPEYNDRAQAALTKAITLLKSRKDPVSQW